ncbi:MAG: ATP-binding protein [Halopseudomonas yangmingensis]
MPISSPEAGLTLHERVLRLFNLYRVVLGFGLALLTSPRLREGLLSLHDPDLYEAASWIYLFIGLMTALMRHDGSRDIHLLVLASVDIFLLGLVFYAVGGVSSGFGSLLLIPVAAGNILLHGRTGLLLPAFASLLLIYLTFFLSLNDSNSGQNYLQAGVLGSILFAVALFVQWLSRRLRQSESLAERQAVSLASLEQLNQAVIQRMRTGILVLNPLQQVHLFNEAAAQLLGRTIIPGIRLAELSDTLADRLHSWQDNPQSRLGSFRNQSNGLDIMPSFKPLPLGESSNLLVFLEDNSHLAQQAQQLKLASLGRLTASIAHEIRNPLGAISHAAQLLGEGSALDAQDRRLVQIIQQHSKRMNRVIETVLELSRRRPSEPQLIDLGMWLQHFREDFLHGCAEGDELILHLPEEELLTRCDPQQLTQVVGNLCQNSLRHSGAAGEARRVWLRLSRQAETELPQLEVIDQGGGIAAEHLEQIFEPFYTTESSGTGLGLYISRELCESNQAQLQCLPAENGCCMRITLAHPKRLV